MGRYYRTASANPMDFMHKLNIPLMERALQFNDQAITDEYAQGQAITDGASSFNKLSKDDEDASRIAQQYSNQIGELTKAIASDPANWRKHSEPLRQLKQDLLTNYKTGEISKIASNYNTYKAWKTEQDKMNEQYVKFGGKKGGVSPATTAAYERQYLSKWNKTNYKNGKYEALQMDSVEADRDLPTELAQGLKDLKASGAIKEDPNIKGGYIIQHEGSWKGVTPQRILASMSAKLGDEGLQRYLVSRQSVGLLHGIYDDKGLINPYSTGFTENENALLTQAQAKIDNTKIADPKKAAEMQAELEAYKKSNEEKINWNPKSGLASIMKGVMDSQSYMNTTDKTKITGDPVWMQKMRSNDSALNRNAANWRFGQGQLGQDRRQAQAFENAKGLLKLKNDYKTAPTAKKATALKEEYAKAYIGEIVGPERDFNTDAGLADRGDESARVRLREALADAAPAAIAAFKGTSENKWQRTVAVEYTNYLAGKPSTKTTVQNFMKMKSKSGRPDAYMYEEGQPDMFGNKHIMTLSTIEEVGKIYNSKVNKWYENTKGSGQQISTNPLTPQAQTTIAESINLSPGSYFGINEKGQRTELPGKVETIIGAVGATGQSKLGYRVKLKDKSDNKGGSDIIWVFPKTENLPTYKLNRANILEGLADKNSVYATALKEEEINDINYLLSPNVGVQTEDGTRNIIQIGRESVAGTLHLNGTVTIKDADGNNEQPFSSVADLVQQYHAAQEAVTKKK